jgi:hypothetical protein
VPVIIINITMAVRQTAWSIVVCIIMVVLHLRFVMAEHALRAVVGHMPIMVVVKPIV